MIHPPPTDKRLTEIRAKRKQHLARLEAAWSLSRTDNQWRIFCPRGRSKYSPNKCQAAGHR